MSKRKPGWPKAYDGDKWPTVPTVRDWARNPSHTISGAVDKPMTVKAKPRGTDTDKAAKMLREFVALVDNGGIEGKAYPQQVILSAVAKSIHATLEGWEPSADVALGIKRRKGERIDAEATQRGLSAAMDLYQALPEGFAPLPVIYDQHAETVARVANKHGMNSDTVRKAYNDHRNFLHEKRNLIPHLTV